MSAPAVIPGVECAGPGTRRLLARLDDVRAAGPGRWVARCPCCDEDAGLTVIDPAWRAWYPDPRRDARQ